MRSLSAVAELLVFYVILDKHSCYCTETAEMLLCLAGEICYVVLHNGCLYVYKDSKQTKPDKAVSLFGYTQ